MKLDHAGIIPLAFPQMLSSTVSNGDVVCPEEEKVFTCETRGSGTIGWRSDVYIGQGSEINFNLGDSTGITQRSNFNQDVIATFLNSQVVDGVQVLTSQLNVTVSSSAGDHSVSCVCVSNGSVATISFQSIGMT